MDSVGSHWLIKILSNDLIMLKYLLCDWFIQAGSKKVISMDDWKRKLRSVDVRKEDMNKLVMNFLVTEGFADAVEKFQLESGTNRILFHIFIYSFLSIFLSLVLTYFDG